MSIDIDTTSLVPTQNPPKHSGGPRTPEGKAASRRNSLKTGVRSKIIFPEDFDALVETRIADFFATFLPKESYEEVLVRDMAVSSARTERCASLAAVDLVRVAERAGSQWDYDRRQSAEDYSARLKKEPARIASGLRGSSQGADLLIESWSALADIARETGLWDDSQRRFAFDLLGVRLELRTGTSVVPDGAETALLIAIAEREIERLRNDQEAVLDGLSESEQALTMAGMAFHEDDATARLRKNESRARSDFNKARTALLKYRETGIKQEPKPIPQPSRDDRTPPCDAAIANLVKRSKMPEVIMEEAEVEETPEPKSEQPEPSGSQGAGQARPGNGPRPGLSASRGRKAPSRSTPSTSTPTASVVQK